MTDKCNTPSGSAVAEKPAYLRFSDKEIDGFLRFLLEGGADKRCSNVYRIIEQQRDDIREARRLLRHFLEKHKAMSSGQQRLEINTVLQVLS